MYSDKCIDVAEANEADGANVQQYTCNASPAQIWTMKVINWQTLEVELVAGNSDKCLDLDAASENVQQWGCSSTDNQRWFLDKTVAGSVPNDPPNLSGTYEIKNKLTGRCLNIVNADTNNGANAETLTCDNSDRQRFAVVDLGNFNILIRPLINTHSCIDVANVSNDNGANVHQWACVGGMNQTWSVNMTDWDTMDSILTSQHSNKCLDEDIVSRNVQQWACSNHENQHWVLNRIQ